MIHASTTQCRVFDLYPLTVLIAIGCSPPRLVTVTESLTDLASWDAASTEIRRTAAEDVARRLPAFALLRLETFSCGGQTHEVAIYKHERSGLEFVLVPAGTFEMGSRDKKNWHQPHATTLSDPFLIARTEVTNAQCWSVLQSRDGSDDRMPVAHLTWDLATAFCVRIGLELPTEAQWERACRAGTTTSYSTGDDPDSLHGFANVLDESASENRASLPLTMGDRGWQSAAEFDDGFPWLAPVASFSPNALGVYDMHGNAEEWCADWFGNYRSEPVADPTGPASGSERVARGGGCASDPQLATSFMRAQASPLSGEGLRPALTVRMK